MKTLLYKVKFKGVEHSGHIAVPENLHEMLTAFGNDKVFTYAVRAYLAESRMRIKFNRKPKERKKLVIRLSDLDEEQSRTLRAIGLLK